jgi:hypothetical protein
MLEFSKKFYFPSPEYSKTGRCTCSQTGFFWECSLSQPGIILDFRAIKQEKSASSWTRSTDLPDTKLKSYLYTTNFDVQNYIFFCQEQYSDL